MRPLTIFFELGGDNDTAIQWKPGFFKGRFKDVYFCRVWWLCFAVGWVKMSLYSYNRHIESGETEWRKK
jgi:hypothetical protein